MRISDFFPEDSPEDNLIKIQSIVSGKVLMKDDFGEIHLIAADDQAFLDDRNHSGIVLMDFGSLEIIERTFSIQPIRFPIYLLP